MKKIFITIALSLFMVSGVYAAPENKVAEPDSTEKAAVDTTKKQEAAPAKADQSKKESKAVAEPEEKTTNKALPITACGIAILALIGSAFAFFNSKSRYEELYDRYRKLREDSKSFSYEWKQDITSKIDFNNRKIDEKILAVKENILSELKAALPEPHPVVVEAPVAADLDVSMFVSQTMYGIFKTKVKGVYSNQVTDNREGNSTMEIVTVSDTEADVHLVSNLSKTQFSALMGDAVDVIEGNPQSFDTITEVEPGKMILDNDIWTLFQKIKVKLA